MPRATATNKATKVIEEPKGTEVVEEAKGTEVVEEAKAPKAPKIRVGASHATEIYHIRRTLSRANDPASGMWTGPKADEALSEMLKKGWGINDFQVLGINPDGVLVLWVLTRSEEGAGFKEAKHIVRTLSGGGQLGTVTGFQADAVLSGHLSDGWELAFVRNIGFDTNGLNMAWVLVR
jgi:hypothetical protein